MSEIFHPQAAPDPGELLSLRRLVRRFGDPVLMTVRLTGRKRGRAAASRGQMMDVRPLHLNALAELCFHLFFFISEKPTECRKRKGAGSLLNRVWKATKSYFHCCCHSCAVDVVEPFVPPPDLEPKPDPEPSSPAPDPSGVKPNNGRSRSLRTASTDSSPGITSPSSLSLSKDNVERRFCGEWLSLSSRGSYIVEWRWSGDISDSRNEQSGCSNCCLSRSESLEGFLCPPLPGQVPVEPTETETNVRTAQGAMEDSPVNKSSTESFESLYNMGKMIGSGGFGRVYNATRKFDGKKVAIKRMRKIDNDRCLNIVSCLKPEYVFSCLSADYCIQINTNK
ncbi:uncharacterized protein LOC130085450 [Rhinichthys klamathensis goyatoka]|uniref:uncharacterized protein LOC130085450 n=1 Tax=Rhinichthys klamathensis goyatoka TaxID=3034132 RepID=UPI0024B5D9EC|nr:uncharacterized protein LOC130085450 [Rhinichthys klamathensis goyatoka]